MRTRTSARSPSHARRDKTSDQLSIIASQLSGVSSQRIGRPLVPLVWWKRVLAIERVGEIHAVGRVCLLISDQFRFGREWKRTEKSLSEATSKPTPAAWKFCV